MRKIEKKRDAKRVEDRRAAAAMSDREIDAVAGGHGMIRAH